MDELIHVSTHLIDKYVAGLLAEEETASVESHTHSCTGCQRKLSEAREARSAFLRANPPEIRARQLFETNQRPSRLRWLAPALAVPTLAALLLVVQPWGPEQPEILSKGGALVTFEIHRPSTKTSWMGGSEEVLRAGDTIQIRVDPAKASYIAVFALDHNGVVTRLMEQRAGGPVVLPKSLVLDDSLEPERLLVVVSQSPIKTEELVSAVRAALKAVAQRVEDLDAVVLPGSAATVESFLVRKEKPPTPGQSDVSPDE